MSFDDVKDFPNYMDRMEDFDTEDMDFLDALEGDLPLFDEDFPDLASSSGDDSDPSKPDQKEPGAIDATGVMTGVGLAAVSGLLVKSLSGLRSSFNSGDNDLTAVVDMDDIQNTSMRMLADSSFRGMESSRNLAGAYVPTGAETTVA